MISDPWSITVAAVVMLTVPGWMILAFSGLWRNYPGLQSWCLAIGLSIALYPVFFYGLRAIAPTLRITPPLAAGALALCGSLTAWRLRHSWRDIFHFTPLEILGIGVFAIILFTRFWVIRDEPYPAWSDSLHHALVTRLTIEQGQLPFTLEPYVPIPLGQYHLGLYALSATLAWLSGIAPHTALLVMAQICNGFCGLGVYLVLDRHIGRVGALVGLIVVGLLAHQPAWYVNWGRFTQLASQTVLLIAWVANAEALRTWRDQQTHRVDRLWMTAIAALLSSAVALLHFRVAAFYLPLVAITLFVELWHGYTERRLLAVFIGAFILGLATLVISAPALWEALWIYLHPVPPLVAPPSETVTTTVENYFGLPLDSIPSLSAHPWLLISAAIALVIGLLVRSAFTFTIAIWSVVLIGSGLLYLTGIWLLAFVNLSGVLILAYLPIALLIGNAVGELIARSGKHRRVIAALALALVSAGGLVAAPARAQEKETFRYFVTPADIEAMNWITANTDPDARFAVNTTFWLPLAPHGTDGGYWISYFTGRATTVGVMINSLGSPQYLAQIVAQSSAVEQLEQNPGALATLREAGVSHIYIGPRGDFSGSGLNPAILRENPYLKLVYERDGVTIFQLTL